jgi:hypothetical protein
MTDYQALVWITSRGGAVYYWPLLRRTLSQEKLPDWRVFNALCDLGLLVCQETTEGVWLMALTRGGQKRLQLRRGAAAMMIMRGINR